MTGSRRGTRLALALLIALAGAFALSPATASAEPEETEILLEISEAAEGTGYGEVICEYREEGVLQIEPGCEELYFEEITQKKVTLKAIPEKGSEFVEFKNGEGTAEACNGVKGPCTFILEEEAYIEVLFEEIVPTLVVEAVGEGEISCLIDGFPEFCEEEEEFEFGVDVVVEPEPLEGWEFASFKNGKGSASKCSGQTTCAFTLEQNSSLEAVFVPTMSTLTVSKAGTGSGTVVSEPGGISCGSTCVGKFAEGAVVTLKATPASGSTFAGWSGEGCSGTGSCVVSLEEAAAVVTATFTASSSSPKEESPKGESSGMARVWPRAKVRGGRALVRMGCSGGPCRGTLKLRAKIRRGRPLVVIGRTSFALAGGKSATFRVKLTAAAMRQLRKWHTLRARAVGTGVAARLVTLRS